MPPRRQGAAFVEIIADTDGFEKKLQKSLDDSVKEASKSKNFDPLVRALGNAGEEAGEEFGDRFEKSSRRRTGGRGGTIVNILRAPFKAAFEALSQIAGKAFVAGFNAFTQSADLGGGLLVNLGKGISGAFASLASSGPVGLGILAGGLVAGLGALIVVAPLAVSAIFAIGGALFSLLGLLNAAPAAFTIATAALVPLVLAFGGFGEALTAIGQGDLEKTNEALKKLSPSARGVAREFQKLQPFFKTLQQNVQEAFFSRLAGGLTALQKALGPAVSGGLQNVAFALGGFVDQLFRFASKPETARILSGVFETTARIITQAGPSIVRFLEAIGGAVEAALPAVESFFSDLGGGLDSFAKFISDSVASGSFEDFLTSAFTTLKDIGVILLEVLGLFKDMFATTDEAGQTFLEDVATAVRKLREFFQAPEGKEFLENMILLAEDFGDILIFIVGVVADIIRGFAKAIEIINDVAEAIDRLFGKSQKLKGSGLGSAFAAAALSGLPKFADGGVTSGPSIAGEAGPEAVLPLNNPVRAAQVAQEAGLANLIGSTGNTIVWVTIDGQQLQGRIDRTVRANNAGLARQLSNGPRGLAVA